MSQLNIMLKKLEEKEKEKEKEKKAEVSTSVSSPFEPEPLKNKSINNLIKKSRGYKKFNPEDPLNENSSEPCCSNLHGCEKRVERTILIISIICLLAFIITLFFYL